jgi:hypothetical protein
MRRRVLLLPPLAAGAGLWLLAMAPLALAAAQKPGPVVEFRGAGPASVTCTSTPDRGSVEVGRGQWLNVVNRTGIAATVIVGQHQLPVLDGRGRSLRLRPGQYAVTMRPACLAGPGQTQPVRVEVLPDPTAEPSGPTRSVDPTRSPGTVLTGLPGASPDELLEADFYNPPTNDQLPSLSILAVIATICVFGVTASIIRAILAQRAAKVVARHSRHRSIT